MKKENMRKGREARNREEGGTGRMKGKRERGDGKKIIEEKRRKG